MPQPFNPLPLSFATDEGVALRAVGDFASLCPEWQKRAGGSDGVINSGSPWVLSSASNEFLGLGVKPFNVVILTGPLPYKASGELFAVDAVAAGTLTLRRLGEATGVGLPPGVGGLTGISFKVKTFAPQLESTSYDLCRRFGIDPNRPGIKPTDLYDPRELEQLTVVSVLVQYYGADARSETGDWARKLKLYQSELLERLDRAALHWGDSEENQPETTRFGTRISR